MLRQCGQAAIATMLLLLFVSIGTGILYFANITRDQQAADQITTDALVQAKEALIGFAAAVDTTAPPGTPPPPNPRPGELPCPNRTTLSDGTPSGIATSPCSTLATRIGWFPWKTLGLPPLRDGSGEYLWYAVSNGFQNNPRSGVLNSDTPGNFTVKVRTTGATEASNVIAVVFAPNGVTSGQIRNSTVTPCSTTGTSIARNLCAANYLEGENADTANNDFETDPTIASKATIASFNDRLLPITSDALFSVVNVRVAKEAITALETYRSTNSYYPFANTYSSGAPYYCNTGIIRGRFPITVSGVGSCGQANWPPNALPAWFSENNWNLVTHYGISKGCGQLFGIPLGWDSIIRNLLCGTPGNLGLVNSILSFLGASPIVDEPLNVASVTGGSDTRVLVIVSGRALGSQIHTCASADQCLEDATNSDGDVNYIKPSRFPVSNDRMTLCSASVSCPAVP